jgi:hypothetical protein
MMRPGGVSPDKAGAEALLKSALSESLGTLPAE